MILDEIAQKTRERIEEKKRELPLSLLKDRIAREEMQPSSPKRNFFEALARPRLSFICEVKKASPSKGVIAKDFPYIQIAKEYEAAGADAISVLTEPYYFQGADAYLREIRSAVSLPILRKDFTIDPYMIYEAKAMGADAILLICAILSREQLQEYLQLAGELGLAALVEAHDEREVEMALAAGATILGVNNRNLKDFTVDINNSLRLRPLVPKEVLFVSESGMRSVEDIQKLRENGSDAVLIGETFMRSPDKKGLLESLRGGK